MATPDWDDRVAAVINVLADMVPTSRAQRSSLVVPTEWFRWQPLGSVALFKLPPGATRRQTSERTFVADRLGGTGGSAYTDRTYGERLAAIDKIRTDHRSLRAGWLWVAGSRLLRGDRRQRVFQPLVTVPLKVSVPPLVGSAYLESAGDVVVSDLITDRGARQRLELTYEVGGGALDGIDSIAPHGHLLDRLPRLREFALEAAAAAGFDVDVVTAAEHNPAEYVERDRLVVVAGVATYTANDVASASAADHLREWATHRGRGQTAFAALYADDTLDDDGDNVLADVSSPYPLTPRQRAAVVSAATNLVTVVSGGPGTGKSQTVVAMALEAIGNGDSVLIAAKSDAAVDALLDLFEDAPGPRPVLFGSDERRRQLAEELAGGRSRLRRGDPDAARRKLDGAIANTDATRQHISERLEAEVAFGAPAGTAEVVARATAPDLFSPSCDLDAARQLLATAGRRGGWWARRAARRASDRLRAVAGAAADVDVEQLRPALDAATRARRAGDVIAGGGTDLRDAWVELAAADAAQRVAHAEWLVADIRGPHRLKRGALGAVAVLATALRSGRAARRAQLTRLNPSLTSALPLWIGTLADIEDLLPPVAALFDLVVLDEASSIDQPLAAPALLRAGRAAVVGDPRQLRHVSFVGDEQLARATENHGLSRDQLLAGRLDVRRNSIFDVAAGAAPVYVVDEHFRSDPHLIDFVAHRLYGGQLQVATTTPATERRDCIELRRLAPAPDAATMTGEIGEVLRLLREWHGAGRTSVGVVSPFRAQADAIEAAVLTAFSLEEIEALDLRIGTVHAFQGNERRRVIVSLGIGDGAAANKWGFVDDRHLFAVLATRARDHMVWLVSADPPARSLMAAYLAAADSPPGSPPPGEPADDWTALVADHLRTAGIAVTASYATGRHRLDLCAGSPERFVGIESRVHPEGIDAHIERRLALMRAGWTLAEAYPSKWGDRPAELVVQLAPLLRP